MRLFQLLLFSSTAFAQSASTQADVNASTIVFVWEHGAAKSVIAAAQFNRLASEMKLPYRAVARGAYPEDAVAPAVRSGLAAEGLDVAGWKPQAVRDDDLKGAAPVGSLATAPPHTTPSLKPHLLQRNDIPP